MTTETLKRLQYFKGKVCTVFTLRTQKEFTERQFTDYFVGVVEAIEEGGVWTTHPLTGSKNFIAISSLVGIAEEQTLDPEKPEDAALIKELIGDSEPEPEVPQEETIGSMGNLARMKSLIDKGR